MVSGRINGRDARTRAVQWDRRLAGLLAPSLVVMILLFGGGLILGALQALGHLPGAGMAQLTTDHFTRVLTDPDFLTSLGLTFHVALTSTVIAAVASVLLALALTRWAVHNRLVHFVLQVPLTVPHLVVAVSMLFLLAPAGLAARLAAALGLIASPGQFPLLVNDRWAVGILLVYIWKEIPFITLMVLSVLQNAGGELSERWFFPGLWPQQWGLRSWQHLLDAAGGQVASGLLQSTALAAATAAVSLAAGVPAGRALGLYAFRGKALLAVLVVLPLIVPPLSVAMAFIWGNCAWSMSAWATARSRWCGTSPFR